jgi:hypothetical protein
VGENRNEQRVLVRQLETIHLVDLGIDGRITVKWILKRIGRRACGHSNGPSGAIQCEEFLDSMRNR